MNQTLPQKRITVFTGFGPKSLLRKIYWRVSPTKFAKEFQKVAILNEDDLANAKKPRPELEIIKKDDKWIAKGKSKKAEWWLKEAYKHSELNSVMRSIEFACKIAQMGEHPFRHLEPDLAKLMLTYSYSTLLMQSGFTGKLIDKVGGDVNKYGEAKKTLDDWANRTIIDMLLRTQLVSKIYSEEVDGFVEGKAGAKYSVTLDPLDGSSNIKSKNSFGTIMGVWEGELPQKGRDMKAAAISLYGPVFDIIYSTGSGVSELVKDYDRQHNVEFTVLHESLAIPSPSGDTIYGIGEKEHKYNPKLLEFLNTRLKTKYKLGYARAAVADTSNVLHYNGLFAYPETFIDWKAWSGMDGAKKAGVIKVQGIVFYDDKSKLMVRESDGEPAYTNGKLRLYYECKPLAFLIEQAGGASWDGRTGSVLDIENSDIDATIPFYIGGKEIIGQLKEFVGKKD